MLKEVSMQFKGFRVLEAAILFARLVKGLKLESATLRKQLTRAAENSAASANLKCVKPVT